MKHLSTTVLKDCTRISASIDRVVAPTPAGRLRAFVLHPTHDAGRAPLVVLHGISRNAKELARLFAPEAARTGRRIVVPHFTPNRWPHFQRPCRAARPDVALAGLMDFLATQDAAFARPAQIFGHSGGAQLAHRFAMLYPNRVARLSLVAAGWYCLPDARMAYPYGLNDKNDRQLALWVRRHRAGLARFLSIPTEILVGDSDTGRDESLRQTSDLDVVQGTTRVARAATYAEALRTAASQAGVSADVTLTALPGVQHDVAQAIRVAGLARHVAGPDLFPFAQAV